MVGVEALPEGLENRAVQPKGSGVCGCYCLFWMEQSVRHVVFGEAASSLGWPSAEIWAGRLKALVPVLKREQMKCRQDVEKLKAATAKKVEKAAAAEAKKMEKLDKEKGKAEAAEEALESIKKVPPGKPVLENLSQARQDEVKLLKMTELAGGCSKCRWSAAGCLRCSSKKMLLYYLQAEGFDVEGLKES